MAGLFAMQLFAAGFCLMIPQAHAMPMAMGISYSADMVAEHCSEPKNDKMNHSACTHCNQPDELFQIYKVPVDSELTVIAVINVELQETNARNSTLTLTSLMPTGPPRSSSIIYTITKRIRI